MELMNPDRWTSGSHYDQWMGRWSRLLAHELLKWLNIPAGLRWIDVCCGSGVVTEAIAERTAPASIVGVDVSVEQINFASEQRARSNIIFQTADAMNLPFPDASFDIAVCGLGLNYIPIPARGLDEFCRVTRPGGTVAVYSGTTQMERDFCVSFGMRRLPSMLKPAPPTKPVVFQSVRQKACAAFSNKSDWKI